LSDLKLDMQNIIGQCFGGAANMSGSKKGVAARLKEVAPHALYVHCYAHVLNLALQDTLEFSSVMRNALGLIQSLHNFFNFLKRENILKIEIGVVEEHSGYLKVKSLCATRWSCRWEAVKVVELHMLGSVRALLQISIQKMQKCLLMPKGY